MSQRITLHPQTPQVRLLRQAAEILRRGGLAAVPTDSAYALCGHLGDAPVLERIRRIRGVDKHHQFTLLCRDLSEIANYARVDNATYRLLKMATPGPYTFILEGSRELPRRILHPRRKTLGLRIPDHGLMLALLAELGEPMLSSTLILADGKEPLADADDIEKSLGTQLDLILDAGPCPPGATTVVDMTAGVPMLVRAGKGNPALFGLDAAPFAENGD